MKENILIQTRGVTFKKNVRAVAVETTAVYAALLSVCLVMPLLLEKFPASPLAGYEQWIMGPVVNCVLVLVGIRFHGFLKIAGAVMLPSVIHILNFYMFSIGNASALYMLPAVWAGNLAMVLGFKYLYANKKFNFILTAAVAITIKMTMIFAGYYLLCSLNIIVIMPLQIQLFVALIGCAAAFAIIKATGTQTKSIRYGK